MMESGFSLISTDWTAHGGELYAIRQAVFIEEQGVPAELERDEHDADCWHVLARDNAGRPIATGRLLRDGHIGRLAVVKSWRGRGVGRAVILQLLDMARQRDFAMVELNAQTQAIDFYARLGFVAEGEEFLEAGIPHRRMRLELSGHHGG